jgi:hypothetical protein
MRAVACSAEPVGERLSGNRIEIDQADRCPIARIGLGDGRADTTGRAGDQHHTAGMPRKACRVHVRGHCQ